MKPRDVDATDEPGPGRLRWAPAPVLQKLRSLSAKFNIKATCWIYPTLLDRTLLNVHSWILFAAIYLSLSNIVMSTRGLDAGILGLAHGGLGHGNEALRNLIKIDLHLHYTNNEDPIAHNMIENMDQVHKGASLFEVHLFLVGTNCVTTSRLDMLAHPLFLDAPS
ncbi:hypothetical protein PG985_004750 [Apiospora marii]|uniref:Adenosine deaminase n=1 Tax=Apiospora marii TaxID=335849 RepID=A0ABR1SC27_9PEZI